MGGRQEEAGDRNEVEKRKKKKKKRLWGGERRKGQVEERCSLGSLKAAGPGWELDPI